MSLTTRSNYQPAVRVGNWFEDICLEQDKLRIFKDLRDSGELLVEKTSKLFNNFHKEIVLEAPKDTIRFGAVVQLSPHKMKICRDDNKEVQAALSVVINELVVRHSQKVDESCELTIAPSVRPCVRNSFRIVGCDKTERSDELLKYGQHFRLECVETGDDPLLLYSAQKSPNLSFLVASTFTTRKCGELNLKLGLSWKRVSGKIQLPQIPCISITCFGFFLPAELWSRQEDSVRIHELVLPTCGSEPTF